MSLLSVRNISKRYGRKQVLRGLSFDLFEHEIVGLLGLNGAGKSTTLSILSGRILSDTGEILFDGEPQSLTQSPPNRIGFVPEGAPLFEDLTVRTHLQTLARLYGLSREATDNAVNKALSSFGLGEVKATQIAALSKGYKRRVALAGAFLTEPKLLFLDEPTDGLDPIQKDRMLELLQAKKESQTLLISTHSLSDVRAICDRVLILDKGELVFNDTVGMLSAQGDAGGIDEAFRKLVLEHSLP